MMLMMFSGMSCSRPDGERSGELPDPKADDVAQTQPANEAGEVNVKHAVFAGGCFWCTEAVFEQLNGVSDVVSGYAGGSAETANYRAVTGGDTGHAEVIRITYDPKVIGYGQLLKVFFATHDPTQLNRQGNDVGTQYRSAIFYADEQEKAAAESYIAQLFEAGVFDKPVVTTLEPLEKFYPAEAYHQDYARQNPTQPYVRAAALPKAEKARQKFPELLKPEE